MTNSLFKDSHITQSIYYSQNQYRSGESIKKSRARVCSETTVGYKQGISVREPAKITFSGLSAATLSNSEKVKPIVEMARNFLGANNKFKNVRKLVDDSVSALLDSTKTVDESVSNFLKMASENLKSIIADAKELVIKENIDEPIGDENKFNSEVQSLVNKAIDAQPAMEKNGWFYTSDKVKSFLKMASETQIIFSAAFSAFLACILRPVAIVALPGKNNKDDKKYAAAHSISSGTIGFLVSLVLGIPMAYAIRKIEHNPARYIKDNLNKYGKINKQGVLESKTYKNATKVVNLGTSAITAIPQAMLTIALIPLVLKHVFKLEKNSHKKDAIENTNLYDYSMLNFKSSNVQKSPAFQKLVGDSK